MTAAAPKFATVKMLEALAADTPKDEVKSKPGRGGSGRLSFIDARFVARRFDSAVGPQLWQLEIDYTPLLNTPEIKTRGGKVLFEATSTPYPIARIGVLCESGWVWKQDIGDFSDIEPLKGSVSDSVKRAAVWWGVAADLYDPDSDVYQDESSTDAAVPQQAEQAHVAEQAVVGQTGLTDAQRGKLFAALAEAGMTGDKRKAFVWLAIQKHSVKDMAGHDLDKVLEILAAPHEDNPGVWENVEIVSAD